MLRCIFVCMVQFFVGKHNLILCMFMLLRCVLVYNVLGRKRWLGGSVCFRSKYIGKWACFCLLSECGCCLTWVMS